MAELTRSPVSVVLVAGDPTAVDAAGTAVAGPSRGPTVARVAPDEAMLVGELDDAASILAGAERAARAVDAHALVLDATDGWSGWRLSGDGWREAFGRLSHLELPDEGFVQGDVAGLPVRSIVAAERILMLVAATSSETLRRRIERRCADLGLGTEGGAP